MKNTGRSKKKKEKPSRSSGSFGSFEETGCCDSRSGRFIPRRTPGLPFCCREAGTKRLYSCAFPRFRRYRCRNFLLYNFRMKVHTEGCAAVPQECQGRTARFPSESVSGLHNNHATASPSAGALPSGKRFLMCCDKNGTVTPELSRE